MATRISSKKATRPKTLNRGAADARALVKDAISAEVEQWTRAEIQRRIEEAVAVERERCAKIAYFCAVHFHSADAGSIASLIRSGIGFNG